jgi:hypothetical protein
MPGPTPRDQLSALPSPLARALAFGAILVAGLSGALIGWSVVKLQCTGDCTVPASIGAIVSTTAFAAGTAIVSVLIMRAMTEWNSSKGLD